MKTRTIGVMLSLVMLSFLGLSLTSCAESPKTVIDSATAALDEARTANGEGYAPEAFKKAEEAYAAAMDEVESQNERIFFTRTYGKATELLNDSTEAANEAKKEAEDRREEVQADADALMKDVQQRFESAEVVAQESRSAEAKDMLEKAGAVLFEADKAFKAGDFLGAYQKAQDAQALIEEVMGESPSGSKRET